MSSKWRMTSSLLATGFAVLLADDRPALAATTITQTMAVSLTVVPTCTITTAPINLGNWSAGAGSVISATGTVTVNCSNSTAWSIDVDAGLHPTGTSPALARAVSNGAPTPTLIFYNLYKDAADTLPWGTTTTGTALTGTGTGANQLNTVYAKTPGGFSGALPNGAYADTVTFGVTF